MKALPHRNRVRIIGGLWRSRVIAFPQVEELRPTPDRVRETLFNWLGQTLHGKHCLDLFAGSGALGFEAASRGAERVLMVERARPALEALKQNAALLNAAQVEIIGGDALQFLARTTETFDVVFLDPPYRADLLAQVLPLLASRLRPEGAVYFENDRIALAPIPSGWKIIKESRAGAIRFHLAALIGEPPS